jgi:hypothetical protein
LSNLSPFIALRPAATAIKRLKQIRRERTGMRLAGNFLAANSAFILTFITFLSVGHYCKIPGHYLPSPEYLVNGGHGIFTT